LSVQTQHYSCLFCGLPNPWATMDSYSINQGMDPQCTLA
jgi:hypothetical protein